MKKFLRFLAGSAALWAILGIGAAFIYLKRGTLLLEAEWQLPWFALLLLVIPFVRYFLTIGQDTRRPRMKIGSLSPLAVGPRGARAYLRDLPGIVRAAALVFLVGALCRPVNISQEETGSDTGIDIMIVMDLSGSMRAVLDGNADDVPGAPNLRSGERLTRIETAKAVVKDFIGRRKSDRIGVVVFAKKAYILSPPTLDYRLLSQLVSELALKVIDDSGTAIGDALATAVARLRRSDAESKVVILLTDGDSNAGKVAPDKAAEIAKDQKCKVYTIQIGNEDEVDVPESPDLFGHPRYTRQRFPVNPELMKRIADQTGGSMFIATDSKGLVDSMHSILDQLEKTRFEAPRSSYEDLFPLLLVPGVLLIGIEVLLRALFLRRFP